MNREIRIVRGCPDAHELAALVVLLTAAPAACEPADEQSSAPVPSRWARDRVSASAGSWARRPHPAWQPPF